MPRKTKSLRQIRFLLSKHGPLTTAEKLKLKNELRSGKVRVQRSKAGKAKKGRRK